MDLKQWSEILKTIDLFKKYVPNWSSEFENIDIKDIETLLSVLRGLFKAEEDAIKEERSNAFSSSTYENNVRYFATQLIIQMVPIHEILNKYDDYRELLKQRHVAYGFYHAMSSEIADNIIDYTVILENEIFNQSLYLGLVEFYEQFYGKFSDNEEAIKLLCKFYPNSINIQDHTQRIIEAIYLHITMAGTPNDFGFAYKGIELVKKYIKNLPIDVINGILNQYEQYKIINEKVYRQQVFSIIEHSIIDNDKKYGYKFIYLDSLVLIGRLNYNIYKKYEKVYPELKPYYNISNTNLMADRIEVLIRSGSDDCFGYWENSNGLVRSFVVDGKVVMEISLIENKNIEMRNTDNPQVLEAFNFLYEDWTLSRFSTVETEQKLKNFAFDIESGESDIEYNHLTFSLLYLNNYRGLKNQEINFEHRFTYDKVDKSLTAYNRCDKYSAPIPHFYGNNIYSLSCIVGKNGMGKTSTVDFLRETFFKLLHLIGDFGISCEDGYIVESEYRDFGVLDNEVEFLVVFNFGEQPFYLTNIEGVDITDVKPFNNKAYKSINELSKVVYFSNMLSVNQESLYSENEVPIDEKKSKKSISKSLNNFRQVDYSEAGSFIQRRKANELARSGGDISSVLNKDLCYQIAFLRNLTADMFLEYFDMDLYKQFTLYSPSSGMEAITFSVTDFQSPMIKDTMKKFSEFIKLPDARIQHFSSGEYAKFSFLSKLYWFLEGYSKNIELFLPFISINDFSSEEALKEGERALIFIDEGELYYHPEWQRRYLKTLIKMINESKKQSKVQIVLTTNSPFIISDILSDDIVYLSKEHQEFDLTFGQNIHTLLKNNFFMTYTIGEYSREVIEKIMRWLHTLDSAHNLLGKSNSKLEDEKLIDGVISSIQTGIDWYFIESKDPVECYEAIRLLIEQIGEPIYKMKLLEMLEGSSLKKSNKAIIAELQREQKKIEEKLQKLKG